MGSPIKQFAVKAMPSRNGGEREKWAEVVEGEFSLREKITKEGIRTVRMSGE
jgi:hypothetical protein